MAYTRYVNTAATAGGDGTTNLLTESSGGAGDQAYDGIESAMTGEAGTLTDDLVIKCCGSTADALTGSVEFGASWTFGVYSVTVEGNEAETDGAHEGNYSTSHYRVTKSISSGFMFRNNANNVIWKRFQAYNTGTGSAAFVFRETDGCTSVFQGMIIRQADDGNCIAIEDASTVDVFSSFIFADADTAGSEGIYPGFVATGATVRVYHCTVFGFDDGMERDDGTMTAINTASFNNSAQDFDGLSTVDNCGSDDGTGTNSQGPLSGWTSEYPNYATGDPEIVSTGNMYAAGTDLSATVTEDITGTTIVQHSIGCWDAPSGPGPTAVVRKSLMLLGVGI